VAGRRRDQGARQVRREVVVRRNAGLPVQRRARVVAAKREGQNHEKREAVPRKSEKFLEKSVLAAVLRKDPKAVPRAGNLAAAPSLFLSKVTAAQSPNEEVVRAGRRKGDPDRKRQKAVLPKNAGFPGKRSPVANRNESQGRVKQEVAPRRNEKLLEKRSRAVEVRKDQNLGRKVDRVVNLVVVRSRCL